MGKNSFGQFDLLGLGLGLGFGLGFMLKVKLKTFCSAAKP